MSDVAVGVRRSVVAMMASLGGADVKLRMPVPTAGGDDGELLGLSTPQFQAMRIAPVVVRRNAAGVQVLVAADVLEQALTVHGPGAVRSALESAADVQVGDEALLLTGVDAVEIAGAVCLYRVMLQTKGA